MEVYCPGIVAGEPGDWERWRFLGSKEPSCETSAGVPGFYLISGLSGRQDPRGSLPIQNRVEWNFVFTWPPPEFFFSVRISERKGRELWWEMLPRARAVCLEIGRSVWVFTTNEPTSEGTRDNPALCCCSDGSLKNLPFSFSRVKFLNRAYQ